MIQNHSLQLLCFVAMEPPVSLNEPDLCNRKVDLLHMVTSLSPEEVTVKTVRARYSAGQGSTVIPADVEGKGSTPHARLKPTPK